MQQYEKDKFYSLLFSTEILCSGHSSESSNICKYAKDALILALELIEYAIRNNKTALYHEIITASKDLDLSNKQTILTEEQKEIICNLYKRFIRKVGDLLEENPFFAYEYNVFLVVLAHEAKRKHKVK